MTRLTCSRQIPCTGQTPNSDILSCLVPDAISKVSDGILVHHTLQVSGGERTPNNIFALGDVAETGGPKTARAAGFQAAVVGQNIVTMIRKGRPMVVYKPNPEIEGALSLTLGTVSRRMLFEIIKFKVLIVIIRFGTVLPARQRR